jgi:hypothetical protein
MHSDLKGGEDEEETRAQEKVATERLSLGFLQEKKRKELKKNDMLGVFNCSRHKL